MSDIKWGQFPKGSKPGLQPKSFPEFQPIRQAQKGNSISYEYAFDSVDDQGQHGTCVANASAAIFEFFMHKRHKASTEVSRLAIYNQAKADNPNTEDMQDDGIYVSDGLEVLKVRGYVEESDYPYTDNNVCVPVPNNLWKTDFELRYFVSVPNNISSMELALAQHGPLIIGLQWAYEWESGIGPDGVLPSGVQSPAGGHCVLIVGFDRNRQHFRLRNSWGPGWADKGYAYLKYQTLQDSPSFWPTDVYTLRA